MAFFRSRYDDHLSRKFFHLTSGTILAYLFVSLLTRTESIIGMGIGMMILLPLDLIRLRIPRLNRVMVRLYGPLLREGEDSKPSAQLYYVLGVTWAVVALPKPVAIHAILCLAWMDPIAAIYGVRFGRRSWGDVFKELIPSSEGRIPEQVTRKTLEGSFAGFVAAFLAGVVAWTGPWAAAQIDGTLVWTHPLHVLLLSVAGAAASVVAEAWPSQWDDNASVPFWCGLIVWALATVIGLPLSYF
ncbi:hypothetical protein GW915_08565 [bacterium]|nr:hypothetical protein [bacterium]